MYTVIPEAHLCIALAKNQKFVGHNHNFPHHPPTFTGPFPALIRLIGLSNFPVIPLKHIIRLIALSRSGLFPVIIQHKGVPCNSLDIIIPSTKTQSPQYPTPSRSTDRNQPSPDTQATRSPPQQSLTMPQKSQLLCPAPRHYAG